MSLQNKWILITGASSGLGLEMAKQLVIQQKPNLILAARREENLELLRRELLKENAIEIIVIKCDLSDSIQSDQLIERCLSIPHFYGAILNAGSTFVGKHWDISVEKMNQILQLNIVNTAKQLTAFVRHFEAAQMEGKLMVVSSLAANFPTPHQALYSGTKAFLTNLTLALRHELTNKKLSISILSPGGIKTEFSQIAELRYLDKYNMSLRLAAKDAVRSFLRGNYNHTPGWLNRIAIRGFTKVIPTRIITTVLGRLYAKSIAKGMEAKIEQTKK